MSTQPKLEINLLSDELAALAQISEAEPPVVTRVVFTEADLRARAYVKGLCTDAGLVVHEDAIGNTFARWVGSEPDLAPIGTGSHIDAIPNAGSYDGTVGVLGGLEAIRALQRAGFRPRRSIELVSFTAEEPTRFGIGCLGSRMMGRVLSPSAALALPDAGPPPAADPGGAGPMQGSVRRTPGPAAAPCAAAKAAPNGETDGAGRRRCGPPHPA